MKIYTCRSCSKIHIETGNTVLNFLNPEKLGQYLAYLDSIDATYYSAINRDKGFKKDIFLQVGDFVNLVFTLSEFEELKQTIRNYLSGITVQEHSFVKYNEFKPVNLN
jgi:hypothetical protein